MSDLYADWVTVVPARGDLKTDAKILLGLARRVSDVRTDENGTVFLVPPYLADAYNGTRLSSGNPFGGPEPTPVPKRRGRPRKTEVKE